MYKAIALILTGVLLLSCGEDKISNGDIEGVTISITPPRVLVDLGSSYNFSVNVYNTPNAAFTLSVEGIAGGDTIYGEIQSSGLYTAPNVEADRDSVMITGVPAADLSVSDTSWVILVNPQFIYVDDSGSDADGVGSLHRPYRTITKAIERVHGSQVIFVGAGIYDATAGEQFPLRLDSIGVTLQGAGMDSTFIIGNGGLVEPETVMVINGTAITLEDCNISTAGGKGVGLWVRPNISITISNNKFMSNYIGIYANGIVVPSMIFSGNVFEGDSIGLKISDSARPRIRNNSISSCYKYGIWITDFGLPNLGTDDTLQAGANNIVWGSAQTEFLIRYEAPDTLLAIGNTWEFPNLDANDALIWDDEEAQDEGLTAGPVILHRP